MYEVTQAKSFKSAFKRLERSGNFKQVEFEKIVAFFALGATLPAQYHDHALKGNLSGKRECHITGNLLLIYEVHHQHKIVVLDGIGTHAELFGR